MKTFIALALASVVCGVGCAVDEKEASCGLLDVYTTASGESYCPDESAPDDCRAFTDTIVRRAAECSDGAFSEEEVRAELDAQGALFDCDTAVATTTGFDTCVEEMESDAFCDANGSIVSLPSCENVLLTDASASE